MADVGIRVTVEGAEQAKTQLEGVNKAIEGSGDAASKASQSLDPVGEKFRELGVALPGVSSALDDVGSKAAIVGGLLGTALVSGVGLLSARLMEAVTSTTELGDKLNVLSQRTGIAVETLSGGLRLAAETSGSSLDGMASGIDRLNRSIAEAADGTGKQADAFNRLGISVLDANGNLKSSEQVLFEIADRFKNAEDGAIKTEIAMILLGRAGADLIPVLNNGSQGLAELEKAAKLAGIQMSGETAAAAARLNENLAVLGAFAAGFWQGIANPIVEGLRQITDAMRLAKLEGDSGFWAGLKQFTSFTFGSSQSSLDLNQGRMATLLKEIDVLQGPMARNFSSNPAEDIAKKNAQLQALIADSARLADLAALERGTFFGSGTRTQLAPPGLPNPKQDDFGDDIMRHTAADGSSMRIPRATRAVAERPLEDVMSSHASSVINYYQSLVNAGEMTKETYADVMTQLTEGYEGFEKARVRVAAEANKTNNQLLLDQQKALDTFWDGQVAKGKEQVEQNKKAKQEMVRDADLSAKEEMRLINETTFLFKEQKIAAMEAVRDKYAELSKDAQRDIGGINAEIMRVAGSHRVAGVVIQDVGFDMMNVWKGVHGALAGTIAETTRWLLGLDSSIKGLGDALKSFATSVVNTMINEFAKLAANEVFRFLFGGQTRSGGGGGADLLGTAWNWLTQGGSGTPGSANFSGPRQPGGGDGGGVGGLLNWITNGGGTSGEGAAAASGGGGGILGAIGAAGSGIAKFLNFGGSAAGAGAAAGASKFLGGSMDTMSSVLGESASGLSDVAGWSEWLGGSVSDVVASGGGGGGLLSGLFGGGGFGGGISSGIGGMVQDIGVSMGSQTIADIGTSLAEGGLGGVTPFIGGALKILQGDVAGGIASTGLGLLGTALGGPIGGAIGSFLGGAVGGLFGDDEIYPIPTAFKLSGTLGPAGFQGSVTTIDQFGNAIGTVAGDDAFASTTMDMASLWSQKLPGATITVPVDATVPVSAFSGALQTWNVDDEGLAANRRIIGDRDGGESIVQYRRTDADGNSVWSTTPYAEGEGPGYWSARPETMGLGAGQNLLVSMMDQLVANRFVNGIQQFASGGEGIFTSPSMIMVGEAGRPERVQVTPLSGAGGGLGRGGVTVNLSGMSMMDSYAARRMFYEMQRIQSGG